MFEGNAEVIGLVIKTFNNNIFFTEEPSPNITFLHVYPTRGTGT